MATNHIATGATYSNLTRRELEQLRKADFFAGGKALTVGDESNAGSINDERFYTGPTVYGGDVWAVRPPQNPATYVLSRTQPSNLSSESVRWYGPTFLTTGVAGYASGVLTWKDDSPEANFTGVQAGDLLIIKSRGESPDDNANAVGVVSNVSSSGGSLPTWTVTLSSVVNPSSSPSNQLQVDTTQYTYAVVRATAVQLWAVPGSGPLGREQTFLATWPDMDHSIQSPSLDQVNAKRIRNLVPPSFSAGEAVDRADAIFQPPAGPGSSLDLVGYRPILYRSLPNGSGPDFTAPLPKNPRIDASVPDADQRMTIDYKAGVFRFSTPPAAGSEVKPAGGNGGTNATTGRLQLWAVYWAVDSLMTEGASTHIYTSRSTVATYKNPARVYLEQGHTLYGKWRKDFIRIGATGEGNDFAVRALSANESGREGSLWEDTTWKTDFGVFSDDQFDIGRDAFRGFRIRGDGKIRMIQTANDSTPPEETRIEDKTRLVVGTHTHPGGDFNPAWDSYYGEPSGLRRAPNAIQAALNEAAFSGQYSTVHLRRSVYRLPGDSYARNLLIPPGVTLEGEGSGTILYQNESQIRIGPNTVWGTYDASVTSPTITNLMSSYPLPTIFELPESFKIEGYDVVWNKSRRVWGIFVAESTTNSIWFNEMRTDGTKVLPGLGINVKDSSEKFFTLESVSNVNAEGYYTPGHYPRVDHDPFTDTYVFCWTEEYTDSTILGPRSYYAALRYSDSPRTEQHKRYSLLYPPVAYASGYYAYSMHPSISVAPSEWPSDPVVCTTCFCKENLASSSTSIFDTSIYSLGGGTVVVQSGDTKAAAIYSSTDCVWVNKDKFVTATTRRGHAVLTGTTGAFDGSGNFSDVAYPSWDTVGVEVGDRFLLLRQTNSTFVWTNGRTGIVRAKSTSTLNIQWEGVEGSDAEVITSQSNLRYAIIPMSRIFCTAIEGSTICSSTLVSGPDESLTATTYYLQEREPDFVRLSAGPNDRVIAVYQNFDTRASASRPHILNFDNGRDSNYLDDGSGIPAQSPYPVRVHLSTNFVIASYFALRQTGSAERRSWAVQAPSVTSAYESKETSVTELRRSNDVELIRRSLGGRDPLDVYPNSAWSLSHNWDDVSLRNYSLPITTYVPSFIPDVTWNGSDWVIVSPTVDVIKSDTGYLSYSGGTQYLMDGTFLFSNVSWNQDPNGRSYRNTVVPNDTIYFPDFGEFRTVSAVNSEHVVTLDQAVNGGYTGQDVNWVLVKNPPVYSFEPPSEKACMKSPGFRVSPEGKIIVSSSYSTFADEYDLSVGDRPKQEVLDRGLFGNTIFHRVTARCVSTNPGVEIPNGRVGLGITIDGVVIKSGDRILVTGWGWLSGIWVASELNWARAAEFSSGTHVAGTDIYISSGSTYGGTVWRVTNAPPSDIVGDSSLTFSNLWDAIPPKGAFADTKYGQYGITWNDLVEGARLEADLGYRGVVVGASRYGHKGGTSEVYSVALSWGDNLYGFLDRERVEGQNVKVRAFRQSFGPYNSGIRNLSIQSTESTLQQVLWHNVVYTRHGTNGCPNPYFATDGYRNVFLHIGVWSYGHQWEENGALSAQKFIGRDPRMAGGYNMCLDAVFTDISGKYTLRKRVFTFPNISRLYPSQTTVNATATYNVGIPEWQRDYLIGTLPQDMLASAYATNAKRKPTYGARAIWTGKTFLGLLIVPRGLLLFDLGTDEEDLILDEAVAGGAVVRDSTVYQMFEVPKIKAFAYIGNGGGNPPGPNKNVPFYKNACNADTRSLEIVDMVEVDACYAEGVLAVVWLAGLNKTVQAFTDENQMNSELGRPILGVTLFRRGQGGTLSFDSGRSNSAFNATSYIIDKWPGETARNGSIKDPKITWNGSGFTVTYIYKFQDSGISTDYDLKFFTFPKEGLRSNFQVVAAHGTYSAESSEAASDSQAIGWINNDGKLCLTLTRETYVVKPGDLILVTKTSASADVTKESAEALSLQYNSATSSNLAGVYPVVAYDSSNGQVQLGVSPLRPGVNIGDLVYGMILSGDGVTPLAKDARMSDGPTSGTVGTGMIVKSVYGIPSGVGTEVSDLWASIYVESQDKYVLFYNRGAYLMARAISSDGQATAEFNFGLGLSSDYAHASVGWNGQDFFVCALNNVGSSAYYWLLSKDLGLQSCGHLCYANEHIGNGTNDVPGPGYSSPNTMYTPTYKFQACSVVWSSKLNKWQVAFSIGWWNEDTDRSRYNSLSFGPSFDISSYTNVVLSRSVSGAVLQPGIRALVGVYANIYSDYCDTTLTYEPPVRYPYTVLGNGPTLDLYETSVEITAPMLATDSTMSVSSATYLPDAEARKYYLKIDDEIVLVHGVSGGATTLSIYRGAQNTVAAEHLIGTTAYLLPEFSGNLGYLGGSYLASGSSGPYVGLANEGDVLEMPAAEGSDRVVAEVAKSAYTLIWPGAGLVSFGGTDYSDVDYVPLNGAIHPLTFTPVIGWGYLEDIRVLRLDKRYLFHVMGSSDTIIVTSTDASEVYSTPDDWNDYLTNSRVFALQREDIVLYTFGDPYPTVEVVDADGVSIENVEFQSGTTDVCEYYPRMGRPFWKTGSPCVGKLGNTLASAQMGQKPHVAPVTATPLGKVELVRFSNVRSKTRGRYGYDLITAAKKGA